MYNIGSRSYDRAGLTFDGARVEHIDEVEIGCQVPLLNHRVYISHHLGFFFLHTSGKLYYTLCIYRAEMSGNLT